MLEKRVLNVTRYSSSNIVRVIRVRLVGYVARMEDRRGANKVLVEKPEGRRPLGRSRV
jgi:hypothetical protein